MTGNQKKKSLPAKIQHFLQPDLNEDLEKEVKEFDNYASYNVVGQSIETRNVLTNLRDVPSMLQDPVIKSALSNVMNTTFQTDSENKVFHTQSGITSVQNELENFHRSIDAQNLVLTIGYNLLLWGQLPFKHCFNKDNVLERVIPIPDFTSVTPIIISGQTIGFMYQGEFHPSYEFTYAQTAYFKNLGGNSQNNYITMGYANSENGLDEFRNEFTYADSYLSSVSKAWKNIQIIEDALLLNRMDQSNYYRIISVNVGGQVYSKAAIKVLNFYRNLFKKVRRVSYDAQGMASKGNNQNFEVIVPKTENQGVDIQDVAGNMELRAVKDLDVQYQRLFSGLQQNASQTGFSEDTPSSLGDSAANTWDKRFAKLCKTYSFATFNALKNIDYLHLRSLGFDVTKDDWTYTTVSATVQDDRERGEALKTAVDSYKELVSVFGQNQLEYDKAYLTKTLLGTCLNSFGVDVDKMLNPIEKVDAETSSEALHASYRKDILSKDAHTMAICGLFKEKDVSAIMSALSEEDQKIQVTERVSPLTLKEICSSVAVNKNCPVDLTGFVCYVDSSVEEIENNFGKDVEITSMRAEDFVWPIYAPKEFTVNVEELSRGGSSVVSKLYVDNVGNRFVCSKKDLLTYLSCYLNEALDVYCQNVIRKK